MNSVFSGRSSEKELLDSENVPFVDIARNMKELNMINSLLGGHRITLKGFKKLIRSRSNVSIVEIGCGGGDNLRTIAKYCDRKGIAARLLGVDINKECIEFARRENSQFSFLQSDFRDLNLSKQKPDIIFSSLFCHHFSNDELQEMFLWMRDNSTLGFFINDLHRHRFAYYGIKWLTRLFSKSYLVKNDAPLSVKRGFVKKDLNKIFELAGIKSYKIYWEWAFRYLIICLKENEIESRKSI